MGNRVSAYGGNLTFYQRCLNSSVLILHLISDEYLTIRVGLISTK